MTGIGAAGRLSTGRRAAARAVVVIPLPLLLGSAAPAQSTAAALRPDAALIDKGDLGIATYAMLFVIVALLIDRWMDRRAINRLADAIDRASKSDGDRNTAMLVQLSAFTSVLSRLDGRMGGRSA